MKMRRKGALIFFIGIDGSGKTAHALTLCKELSEKRIRCTYVRPRYALFRLIPSVLREWVDRRPHISPRNITISCKTQKSSNGRSIGVLKILITIPLLVYAFITYFLTIRPLLDEFIVICDRFFFDWFYNMWGNVSTALIRLLPRPDIAFLLDVPVTIAFSRMHYALDRQIPLGYYESLRNWYLMLARQQGFFIVDSSGDFEEVKCIIKRHVVSTLGGNG